MLYTSSKKFFTFYTQVFHMFPLFFMHDFKQSPLHYSVLWKESAIFLNITESTKHIDATLGMGGHAQYFFTQNPHLHILGFDQDAQARTIAQKRLNTFIANNQLEIIPENFQYLKKICTEKNYTPTSILFDIGVSSLQFDDKNRGFSYRFKAPLDMRMDQNTSLTAHEIINTWSQEQLQHIFSLYGEEKYSYRISKKIIEQRKIKPFETTTELANYIVSIKPFSKKTLHPASLVFQALRIAVNNELEVLETAIHQAIHILAKGGRLAVITFHSLEDRIVKNVFEHYISKEKRNKYKQPTSPSQQKQFCLKKITKKPLTPSETELAENSRSHSAKMRVVEKL